MKNRHFIPVDSTLTANKIAKKLQMMGVKPSDMYSCSKLEHVVGLRKASFWQTTHFFTALKSGLVIGCSLGLAAYFVVNQFEISFVDASKTIVELIVFTLLSGLGLMLVSGGIAAWLPTSKVTYLKSVAGANGIVLVVECSPTLVAQIEAIVDRQVEKLTQPEVNFNMPSLTQ